MKMRQYKRMFVQTFRFDVVYWRSVLDYLKILHRSECMCWCARVSAVVFVVVVLFSLLVLVGCDTLGYVKHVLNIKFGSIAEYPCLTQFTPVEIK